MKKTCYKGPDLSPEFKSYARKWRKTMNECFQALNGEVTKFSIGFYYWSGFGVINGQTYYFSVSDCRHFSVDKILIRTAKNDTDYTGGTNHYLKIDQSIVSQLMKFTQPSH